MAELCTFYSRQLFYGLWYITEPCPAGPDTGYQTPQNKVLRGIKPQGTNMKEYLCTFKTEFKNILGCEFGDYKGSICGKNQRSKISSYYPFK
jgi:hypothetical protein